MGLIVYNQLNFWEITTPRTFKQLKMNRAFSIAYLILKKSGRVKLSQGNRQSVQNQVTRQVFRHDIEFSGRLMAFS